MASEAQFIARVLSSVMQNSRNELGVDAINVVPTKSIPSMLVDYYNGAK